MIRLDKQIPKWYSEVYKMEKPPVHIDEYGVVRFKVHTDDGVSYEFEQEPESALLFITVRDYAGRAEVKKVIDTELIENKEIVEMYKGYIRGENDKQKNDND